LQTSSQSNPSLGVVVVTFQAEAYVTACLESVLATGYDPIRVVVVDNASPDGTADAVRAWATGRTPFVPPPDWPFPDGAPVAKPLEFEETDDVADPSRARRARVTLVASTRNGGFAAGVNTGLRLLAEDRRIEAFWILNPDTIVEPQAPFAFARKAREMGRYGVIGGRVVFMSAPERVQADAGRLHPLAFTGVSLNQGALAPQTSMPSEDTVDYIPGVSMVVSRAFLDRVGPMDETYFLYFEEIDWQMRRGDLPFGLEAAACVRHRAGAAIGSSGWRRAANAFSIYFTTRNLLPFVARWSRWRLPFAYGMAWVKLARHWGFGQPQVSAFLRGLHGLGPPAAVRARLPDKVWSDILRSTPSSGRSGTAGKWSR